MPLVKHVSGDFYCYAEDAGKGAWAYGPLHHSEIPATAADAMEILEAQDRERMEEDGTWLYDEIVANRAFGVDYPAPTGREPLITDDRPGFDYTEPVTGRTITYTVGYITDEYIPVMALFVGDDNTPIIIPADILLHAAKLGAEKKGS